MRDTVCVRHATEFGVSKVSITKRACSKHISVGISIDCLWYRARVELGVSDLRECARVGVVFLKD
jgi:hypothetical protein